MDQIPVHQLLQAFDLGFNVTGNQFFGLTVGEYNPMRFGKFSKVITRSISLYDALQNCARYVNLLNSNSHIWVSDIPSKIMLCRSHPSGWQQEQYVLRHMIGVVQMAHGTDWRPKEVFLCSAQTNGIEDSEMFADTTFHLEHPFLAISISEKLIGAELKFKSEGADNNIDNSLQETAGARDFRHSLYQAIEAVLPHGLANIPDVSDIVGISKRTLQRRLADEGESFRDAVGRVRFSLACNLLKNTDMPLRDIAYNLKYSNEAHLIRAFKRWAGTTPGRYRELH